MQLGGLIGVMTLLDGHEPIVFRLPVNLIDNGAISSVIQPTNQSCVPSSRPRTDVRPNGKDTRSNAEHKVEQKR